MAAVSENVFYRCFGLFILIASALSCSLTRDIERELKPWKQVRISGIGFSVPERFQAKSEAGFTLFRPGGEQDPLPFIGVKEIREGVAQTTDELLADLLPRAVDASPPVKPVIAKIDGRRVRGLETKENGVHGFTFVLEKNDKPIVAFLLGAPAHWSEERVQAFRDRILAEVKY